MWTKCLGISDPLVKYCIYGSYLIAILLSKNKCVENMVARLGIGVKGIRGEVLSLRQILAPGDFLGSA